MRTMEERIEELERAVAASEKAARFWRQRAVALFLFLLIGVGVAAAPQDLTTYMGQQFFIANPGGDKFHQPYIVEIGPGDGGGVIVVRNAAGKQAMRAFAGKTGNELDVFDGDGKLAVRLMGDEKGGTIQVFGGKDRARPVLQLPASKEGAAKKEVDKDISR